MNNIDLEELRAILGNDKITIAKAIVINVIVEADMSCARAKCRTIPGEKEAVAIVTFPSSSKGSGDFNLPVPDDLVLLAFADPQEAYVLGFVPNEDDLIPAQAAAGDRFVKSQAGKKLWLSSDTRINIGKGIALSPPTEPLVLGNILVTLLTDMLTTVDSALNYILTGPIGIGNLGASVPSDPALVTNLTTLRSSLASYKSSLVTTSATNILSQTAFTER